MAVAISCAGCSRPLRVADSQLGQLVRCPLCYDIFTAEAPPAVKEPLPVAVEAELEEEVNYSAAAAPLSHHDPADDSAVPVAQLTPEPELEEPPPGGTGVPAGRWDEDKPSLRRPQRAATELHFGVFVTRDSERVLRGRAEAELSEEGLLLYKGGSTVQVLTKPGTARYRGGNRFAVRVDGRQLELTLIKSQTAQERLTKDVVAFLNEEGDLPRASVYAQPWLLTLLPLLGLGIPALAVPLEVPSDDAGFVALWVLGSTVLMGLGYIFLFTPRWTLGARVGTVGGLLGFGYLAFLIALLVGHSQSKPAIPSTLWQSYQGNGFVVQIPGRPRIQKQREQGQRFHVHSLVLPQYQARFVVEERELPANLLENQEVVEALFDDVMKRMLPPASPRPHERAIVGRQLYPCREWVYDYPVSDVQKGVRVVRAYVTERNLYTLVAEGPWQPESDGDARKFMDSFQLHGARGRLDFGRR